MGQTCSRQDPVEPDFNPWNPDKDPRFYGMDTYKLLAGLQLRNFTTHDLVYCGNYLHRGQAIPALQPQSLDAVGKRFMAFHGSGCFKGSSAGLVAWELKGCGKYLIFLWEVPKVRLFGAANTFCMGITVFRPRLDEGLFARMRNGRPTFFHRSHGVYPNSIFTGSLVRHKFGLSVKMGTEKRICVELEIKPVRERIWRQPQNQVLSGAYPCLLYTSPSPRD